MIKRKAISTTVVFIFLISISNLFGQSVFQFQENISWYEEEILTNPTNESLLTVWSADNCSLYSLHPEIPRFVKRVKLPSRGTIVTKILNVQSEDIQVNHPKSKSYIKNDFQIYSHVEEERSDYYAVLSIFPCKETMGTYQRLTAFNLKINFTPTGPSPITKDPVFVSKLSDGDLYKIEVNNTGIQKLNSNFLISLGIKPEDIDPRKIQILGNGGGKIERALEIERTDDLVEQAIIVSGEADGNFDSGDYVLFYGEESDVWHYKNDSYQYEKNVYDESNYYFLKIATDNGKRINSIDSGTNASYNFNSYDYLIRYEEDSYNLLGSYGLTQGSGQQWYGDRYDAVREKDYSSFFRVPNLVAGTEGELKMKFLGRSSNGSTVALDWNSNNYTKSISLAHVEEVESIYAKTATISENLILNSDNQNIVVSYPSNGANNVGWLDYIQLKAKRSLRKISGQMIFSDEDAKDAAFAEFQISGIGNNISIWDITESGNHKNLNFSLNGDQSNFTFETEGKLRKFIAFDENEAFFPTPIGPVANQNLHSMDDLDFVIVYHPDFQTAAERLYEHRQNHNSLDLAMVNIYEVYNEFSSGRVDPSAIRDFAKMLYDRNSKFKFLLLFGDGSYDYRGLDLTLNDQNFIPVFETEGSVDPIESFPTDDYYALLSDTEGDNLIGALDIAVGRIPVRTAAEADAVVTKIIHYETSARCHGDWRLKLLFNADDEDGNTHLEQADGIANKTKNRYQDFNIFKNYWDAYEQVTTPGGDRYPGATEALAKNINSGVLLSNYLGHGGSKGWSQERILKLTDIQNYNNYDRLTTFITATCSFTGYDDPALITAGELCLSNPNGAAVALLTTTRAVYISGNKRLTEAVYDTVFSQQNGDYLRLGEVMRRAKNTNSGDTLNTNARKFAMIGDPTMKLAIPQYDIVTGTINGTPIDLTQADTIRALDKVTITGHIANFDGSINTDFNGIIYPTVYDKESQIRTLVNDTESDPASFQVRKNVLFKGSATVSQGQFSFTFVVPKDIDYSYGFGKISYYASDNISKDAGGFYANLIVGGSNPYALADDQGPTVELYMDNTSFVYGGTTQKNATLLVHLSDENGINISGNSIGHDLKGTLDEDQVNSFKLNDFYTSDLDDYTSGKINYPLTDLSLGNHKITVKAWDIANNSTEQIIEFVVVESGEVALERVLNYPNPFTTSTDFRFETDLINAQLDVLVQIFTLSGKLVKNIQSQAYANNGTVTGINWNGNDEYESRLAKGVYLYKIKVSSEQLNKQRESNFEKLVILK